jgi:hypothetical protein
MWRCRGGRRKRVEVKEMKRGISHSHLIFFKREKEEDEEERGMK